MYKLRRLLVGYWLMMWALYAGAASTEMMEWTAKSGHILRARFVALEGNLLRLQGEDGSVRDVELSQLNPESQSAARTQALASLKAADGSAKNVLHESRTDRYRLQLFADQGWGLVEVLDNGTPSPVGPIILRISVGRYVNQRYTAVPLEKVHPPEEIAEGVLRWSAALAENGSVEIEARVASNMLEIGYQVVLKPSRPGEVIQTTLRADFPPSVVMDEDTQTYSLPGKAKDAFEWKKIPQRIPGHELHIRRSEGRRQQVLKFWDPIGEAYLGHLERALIKGMFAPHDINVELPKLDVVGSIWIYGGGTPSTGFALNMVKNDPATPPTESRLTLKIGL